MGSSFSTADPQVTVLVAARDAADTLPSTLASVARQRGVEWECVVVDDGSRRPVELPNDPRFTVLRTSGVGAAEARNAGLARCRAPYVAVLDADDLMRAQRLERQVAALDAHPNWSAVGCWPRYFPRAALGDGMLAYERWLHGMRTPEDVRRNAWIEMPVGHPTLVLRRAVLAELGGWRERGWPEDWDLLLRLLFEHGGEVGVVPERLLAWRRRLGSLSRSEGAYSIEAFQRCRAHHLARHVLADRDEYVLWGHGRTGRALRRELARHGKHPTHVVEVHPRRLGRELRGAPAIPPQALRELAPERILVSVAGEGPRSLIRASLAEMGFREGSEFVCTA